MKLIVGLGNPGRKYEQTRHNIGFMVAAKVASLLGAGPSKVRFEGEWAEGTANEKIVVLWPQTFMNASGKSVRKASDFYKLSPEEILVICDDLNLTSGKLRIRPSGSAGGQKGLADIIRHLGTEAFPRLRIGIDRPPPGWEAPDYVLGKFSKQESEAIEQSIARAARAAIDWANEGIGVAMNRYNADPSAAKSTTQQQSAKHQPTASTNLSADALRDKSTDKLESN